jgi:glycosyltransferase involved in cell wall biosynthesis
MRVAIVQDWLTVDGGAEKVLAEIIRCFPQADIFSLIEFMPESVKEKVLMGKNAKTSWIQKLPFAKKYYRNLLPFFPAAIESFNFKGYDVIISSSYCVAKGIKRTKGKQIHICYCHSPIRYAWDLKEQYLSELHGFKKFVFKIVLKRIAKWDLDTVDRVDYFIANSKNIQERISRIYNRESEVIYPPVDLQSFTYQNKKEDYYFTSCRLVPYKKVELIVDTFNKLPNLKLVVAGDGPELEYLKSKNIPNVEFLGYLSKKDLIKRTQQAKAFVLAAYEDFGITSLEAQACGTPVIALEKGGYLETVLPNQTGVFFKDQNIESLKNAIENFEKLDFKITQSALNNHIEKFSIEIFRKKIKDFVLDKTK